jgi:hypothetical protein
MTIYYASHTRHYLADKPLDKGFAPAPETRVDP